MVESFLAHSGSEHRAVEGIATDRESRPAATIDNGRLPTKRFTEPA